MRMRRKKHLIDRLSEVKDCLIQVERDILDVQKAVQDKKYFDYQELFGNQNSLEVEIGCGKGGFILETAKKNPNVNYIAVEMMQNIIVMAVEKAYNIGLKNVRFINSGAEYLPRYLRPKSVDTIYLNFSPPYPQNSYENRRLSNPAFLDGYKSYLKDNGEIYLKTDDKNFFDYSAETLAKNGFAVQIIEDLEERKTLKNSVVTEYESKFLALGMPIYYLRAKLN